MKKRKLIFIAILAIFFILALSPAGRIAKPTVVIISLDGMRWDVIDGVKGFSQLEKSGFRAKKMRSVFPSQTCPSHASIATGVNPRTHGIVSNQFLEKDTGSRYSHDNEARWLQVPPLWVLAEKAGLKTAVSGWPVSAGPWKGVSPSEYRDYDQDLPDRDTIEWVISLLERKENKPALIMAWMHGCDGAGHAHGPNSAEYKEVAVKTGQLIEELSAEIRKAGLEKNVVLLLTSDHGMSGVKGEIDIVPSIKKKGFLPYIAISGPAAMVYTANAGQHSSILKKLRGMKKDLTIFSSEELPAELSLGNSSRVGDIIAVAPPGFIFAPFKRGAHSIPKGYHGWPPPNPDMYGIFFAEGPGVPIKTVDEASIVDIAPTALKILGIDPPANIEGKPLF
jgi:predicted AlkP superfamily pyrophosphatase or phosphodiesterase